MKECKYCKNLISEKKYDSHITKHERSIESRNYRADKLNEAKLTLKQIETYLSIMDIDSIESIDLSSLIFCVRNRMNTVPSVSSSNITIRSNIINAVPETFYKIKNIDARIAYGKLYFTISYDQKEELSFYDITIENGNIKKSKNLKIVFDSPHDISTIPEVYRLWFKARVKAKLLTDSKKFYRNVFRIYEV